MAKNEKGGASKKADSSASEKKGKKFTLKKDTVKELNDAEAGKVAGGGARPLTDASYVCKSCSVDISGC